MVNKATYYRDDGSEVGPLPVVGDWPARYAERGLYLQPPHARRVLLCVIEDCPHSEEGEGFTNEGDLVAHAREGHEGAQVWRNLGTGELVYSASVEPEPESEPAGSRA